jgi:site-specific DNA-methyltransferase (adenine-specific)
MNNLYYGDNLEVLRKKIQTESVDLCYIDPPFNSKRNYNQIYNNMGEEDRAQSQAFIDTWTWDDYAIEGYQEILDNKDSRFTKQTIELVKGFNNVLGKGSLLAYLISMSLRITEIQRCLKSTGSFYLHCDPTAGHYLKLIVDSVFVPRGGQFHNELIWHYRRWTGNAKKFQSLHDNIYFYTKSDDYIFNTIYTSYTEGSVGRKMQGVLHRFKEGEDPVLISDKSIDEKGVRENDVWAIPFIAPSAKERLGYPTQKPEALLERIINASSDENGLVLDAYCGCGTTVAVAQQLKRRWIGIDITYQSIALILWRLEKQFGKSVLNCINLDGIPRVMASAYALANKKDDRVRKEFEKWAVMTYTRNRAIINHKRGADAGIDGIAYFRTTNTDNAKIILQVKSGIVGRNHIATLRGDMQREGAAMAVFITLEPPTAPMIAEAKAAGIYHHDLMDRNYDVIDIVTVQDIIENDKVLDIPMSHEVLKAAQLKAAGNQLPMLDNP